MKTDPKQYNILVIEDNPGDYLLVELYLTEKISDPKIDHVSNFKSAKQVLESTLIKYEVILLDLSLPDKSGNDLISDLLKIAPNIPIIILSGNSDIDFSIRSISQGVMDYIIKEDLNAAILYKSIVYALERKKTTSKLEESEKRYSDLFHLSPQPMCLYEPGTFRFLKVNKASIEHYGFSLEEFLGMTMFDIVPADERAFITEYIKNQERVLNITYGGKFRNIKKSGEVIEVETFSTPLMINEQKVVMIIAMDVTEKNLYEHKITKAIIKTQEDERYEIGGELHDNVCQILAGSLLSLNMLRKSLEGPAIEWFDHCNKYIRLAADEIRNLSHRLAPAFFDDSTLEEAFRLLLKDVNIDQKYETVLNYHLLSSEESLGMELKLNLYRILQEQLKNISKYAFADYIEVGFQLNNGRLVMTITDNGSGFDVRTVKRGIGFANMKRRAELFDGKFQIISSPGSGCSVLIDIPIFNAAPIHAKLTA
jgi:PAS domain S-box-containing protein